MYPMFVVNEDSILWNSLAEIVHLILFENILENFKCCNIDEKQTIAAWKKGNLINWKTKWDKRKNSKNYLKNAKGT